MRAVNCCGTEIMRSAFVCLACVWLLLAALFLPGVGAYTAIVIIAFALLPVGLVQEHFGPAINGIARSHGLDGNYLTIGIVAALIFCPGAFCLIKALWDRNPKIAVPAIVSLGYLAVTILAYFRLGPSFHG
jgi:hypothetical protein